MTRSPTPSVAPMRQRFVSLARPGNCRPRAALDYETKNAYTVTVSVSDGNGGSNNITVTINVTDVTVEPPPSTNNAPVFTEGASTTRTVAENTVAGINIGSVVAATDADNDILTYSLGGTNASSFRIVSTSGQLQTNAALDYETKSSYSVSVSVSDGNGGSDSITVTISVTDVVETGTPPVADGICRVGDTLAPRPRAAHIPAQIRNFLSIAMAMDNSCSLAVAVASILEIQKSTTSLIHWSLKNLIAAPGR